MTPEQENSVVADNSNQQVQEQPIPEPQVIPLPEAAEGEVAATPKEDAYQPNYKFKVLDQEKEFDEWIRTAVNKDNEAKIRELYEKAHGLDHVKSQREQERSNREKVEQEFSQFYGGVQEMISLRDKDLGRFFEKVKIPRAKVAQWLLEEAKREELPEETKRVYSEREAYQRQLEEREQELQSLQEETVSQAVQARQRELQSVLGSDDVKAVSEAFDQRTGKAGSFMDAVIRHGKAEWEASGGKRDLSPAEAVKEVLHLYGLQPAQAASPAATPNGSAQAKKVVAPGDKPTVLPNVGAGNAAPAGNKRPRSTDDLRKLYKSMTSAG